MTLDRDTLLEAAKVCRNKLLRTVDDFVDDAYNDGVHDCIMAIEALAAQQGEKVTDDDAESLRRHGEEWKPHFGTRYWNHTTRNWEKDKPAPIAASTEGRG